MIPARYINAGPLPVQASMDAAMAAGRAQDSIGKAISQVGELGFEHLEKARKIEEGGKINAFMAQADEEAGKFSIDLARRNDTDAWPQEWQDKSAALRDQGKALGLSPEGQAVLDSQFTTWNSTHSINFQTQAVTKKLGIAKSQTTQSLEYYAARGDRAGFERTLATGKASGILNAADEQAANQHFAGREADITMNQMLQLDPQRFAEMPSDELLKKLPGATLDSIEQKQREAKGVAKERAFDTVEAAQDDIVSGKVTTPEMIDQNPRYAGLRPMVREKLKSGLAQYQFEKAQGLMNTPEAEVVGKVSSLLSGWEPKAAEDADLKYADIAGTISRLPDGAMKDELTRQAKAIRSGSWQDSASHADAAMKALDAAAANGRLGKVEASKPMKTSDAIQAGFLNDPQKLKQLGYSDEQIGRITEPLENSKRQQIFQQEWTKRGKADPNVPQEVWQTGMAIRTGANDILNPEAEDAAISSKLAVEKRLGEAKMKLTDFLRTNPKATPEQIDGKILEIGGEQTHRELKSGIYDGKRETSGGPAGASDSTASLPVGKDLTEIVKNFEAADGFKSKAYWDYGQWSIGYGTKAKEGETIDQAEADKRLASELGTHRARVTAEADKLGLKFSPAQLDALTSFDFNTGKIETLLAGGKRSKQEIADMMLLYRNAGGERLKGLENRRKAERHLFLHGHADEWQGFDKPGPETAAVWPPADYVAPTF